MQCNAMSNVLSHIIFVIYIDTDLLGFENCLDPSVRCFGPYAIRTSEVFYESNHSVALVNLKPIVPGKVSSYFF